MDKKNVPYYPYRDDGEKIINAIRELVTDFIKSAYAGGNIMKDTGTTTPQSHRSNFELL